MTNWINNRFNLKDEYYTPKILVDSILPYVKPFKKIWCPFDTTESEFVIGLTEAGHEVICSHIWTGKDFFLFEPPEYECIVSNPPFSQKLAVLERLYRLNKPFAVLFGLPILNYQEVGAFFLDKSLQLLIVDKKVSFDGNTASFNTSYFCNRMLPRDLMFAHLEHNNSNKHFIPSRMYTSNQSQDTAATLASNLEQTMMVEGLVKGNVTIDIKNLSIDTSSSVINGSTRKKAA